MHRFGLRTPIFRERKIPQVLVPPRVAGRCGPRGGTCDPRALSCTVFDRGSTSSRTAYSSLPCGHESSQPPREAAGWDGENSATRPSRRVFDRWRGTRPTRPGKAHTGPHGRQRGALCLYSTVCFFSVLISSLFFLFYPIAL